MIYIECKYCNGTKVWISPVFGNEYPCEECKTEFDCVQYDVGSGELDSWGNRCWRVDGERHRLGGPAMIESGGNKYWYQDGKRHREDGPAVECPGDMRLCSWWLLGIEYTEEDWKSAIQKLKLLR